MDISGIDAWIVIPARGGSVGIPRKNLVNLAGKPLIQHVIETSNSVVSPDRIVVITDDEEIAYFTGLLPCLTLFDIKAADELDTIDQKILRNMYQLRNLGISKSSILVTIQPTSPLVSAGSIERAILMTHTQGGSVISVINEPHLSWKLDVKGEPRPNFEKRVNRQALPDYFRETGSVISAHVSHIEESKSRISEPISLLELPIEESTDIDSFSDFFEAWHWLTRLKICIRVDGGTNLGMGHLYRGLAIAYELARHKIQFVSSSNLPLGKEFFKSKVFEHKEISDDEDFLVFLGETQPDLVILDVLNSDPNLIRKMKEVRKGIKVVCLEDDGLAGLHADLTLFDLVAPKLTGYKNILVGSKFAILAPSFELKTLNKNLNDEVKKIVIFFGGTDPSGLAFKTLTSLKEIGFKGKIIVFRGLGAPALNWNQAELDCEIYTDSKSIPHHLDSADMAFTAAGRTVFELASKGIPSICMAQNEKEMNHIHANLNHGTIMIGLGSDVSLSDLNRVTQALIERKSLRWRLSHRALQTMKNRNNKHILQTIFNELNLEL